MPGSRSFGGRSTPWSLLESTNLVDYAANLRRAGCPPETLCDILAPAADREFTLRRERAGWAPDFWASGAKRRESNRAAAAARAALQAEAESLRTSLPCGLVKPQDWTEDLVYDLVAGFAGPEVRDRIVELLGEIKLRAYFWQGRSDNIYLPEELDSIRRERETYLARFASLLAPAQMEEFNLRAYFIKRFLFGSGPLEELGLTAAEFREFCRIEVARYPGYFVPLAELDDLLGSAPDPIPEEEVAPALRALLGNNRYESYRLKNDPVFQGAARLAEEFKQPPEIAAQAAKLMSDWRAEMPSLRERWNADRESGRAALLERREEYRRGLEQILAAVPEANRRPVVDSWTGEAVREAWRKP